MGIRIVCMVGVFPDYIAHTYAMKVLPLGEGAYLVRDLGQADPFALTECLRGYPGVVESVSAYNTIAVYVDHSDFILTDFVSCIEGLAQEQRVRPGKLIEIPACYELGLDFEKVCDALRLEPSNLIQLHSSVEYRCYAIGFCPGFPYLGYLPMELEGLGRLPTPRVRVPAGSIGITGKQTGIYPQESPGGWHLIARTPSVIASINDSYFPISAGDRVRFIPVSPSEYNRLEGQRL